MRQALLEDIDVKDTRSDEELLACSCNTPSAFSTLLDRYQEAFVRKAYSIIKNEEDAHDIVQETFTKIYMHAGSFQKQEGASFKSWAYKILMNTSFTYYKKRKREWGNTAALSSELYEMLPDLQSRTFEKYSFADYVASVIARMPTDLGRALELHFLKGKPQAEVAMVEGVSVGAVKTRIHRAKKSFREIASLS